MHPDENRTSLASGEVRSDRASSVILLSLVVLILLGSSLWR
jgi:hypothetical protein